MSSEEKIVVRAINKPTKADVADIDELSNWFCKVFDLAGKNDELEPRMLKEIVENNTEGSGVTSKILNERLEVPRTTIIYHLNRFIYSGLVIRKGRKYYLRSESMVSTIEVLQSDMDREFNRIREFAEKMDELLDAADENARKRSKKSR